MAKNIMVNVDGIDITLAEAKRERDLLEQLVNRTSDPAEKKIFERKLHSLSNKVIIAAASEDSKEAAALVFGVMPLSEKSMTDARTQTIAAILDAIQKLDEVYAPFGVKINRLIVPALVRKSNGKFAFEQISKRKVDKSDAAKQAREAKKRFTADLAEARNIERDVLIDLYIRKCIGKFRAGQKLPKLPAWATPVQRTRVIEELNAQGISLPK